MEKSVGRSHASTARIPPAAFAHANRCVAQRRARRAALARKLTLAALVACAALALTALALSGHAVLGTHALKAAGGFNDVKPIEGMSHFIDALKGNLSWLFITALVLVILVVGGLFMAGHSRAHDFAIRVVVGVAIIACAGGIVA